jgi:hypothetical protein
LISFANGSAVILIASGFGAMACVLRSGWQRAGIRVEKDENRGKRLKVGNCNCFGVLGTLLLCVKGGGRLSRTWSEGSGTRHGAANAAAVATWRTAPGDGQIRAHAQELITFPRGRKTDWGKKCRIFEDFFEPQMDSD